MATRCDVERKKSKKRIVCVLEVVFWGGWFFERAICHFAVTVVAEFEFYFVTFVVFSLYGDGLRC